MRPGIDAEEGKAQEAGGSLPSSRLSLADIERRHSHPMQTTIFLVLILSAVVMPYWLGRVIAVRNTMLVVRVLGTFTHQGIVLIAWTATVMTLTGFAFCFMESRTWWWRTVLLLGLSAEQLIAGACMLKFDFWYSTYVLYGDQAGLANAADLGIIAAGLAAAVFAVVFVGLLVLIRKDSPLNVLTHGWVCFLFFFGFEVVALVVVMFGGLLITF